MANLRVDKIAATLQTAELYRLDAGAGTGMDPLFLASNRGKLLAVTLQN